MTSCFWKNRHRKHTLLSRAWTCSLGSGTGQRSLETGAGTPQSPVPPGFPCGHGDLFPLGLTQEMCPWDSFSASHLAVCLCPLCSGGAGEGGRIQEEGGKPQVGSAGKRIASKPLGVLTSPQTSLSASFSHYCSKREQRILEDPVLEGAWLCLFPASVNRTPLTAWEDSGSHISCCRLPQILDTSQGLASLVWGEDFSLQIYEFILFLRHSGLSLMVWPPVSLGNQRTKS